jgi:hypothetical protein
MKLNEVMIQYHDKLNPKIWEEDGVLKDDVHEALVNLAKAFIEFLEIDNSYIEDVVLTGSNCNYNWNSGSDLDIHVVVNYPEFQKTCSTVDIEEMFKTKKSLWNSEHEIDINGIPTEMYVQNSVQDLPKDDSLFSLGQNEWITPPSKIDDFKVDDAAIKAIVDPIKKQIKAMIDSKTTDLASIEALQDKISDMRKKGLAKNGQFGTENLAFKKLRNDGEIERLWDYYSKVEDESLSL